MLKEWMLDGTVRDKVAIAIDRLKAFEPPEGYYLAFSGGKDSQTIYHLAKEAGVKFDAHYNLTTVDPPELIWFIKENYPDVIIEKPEKTMWQLIEENGSPPMRQQRYCCRGLKERGGEGRITVTGVRWDESVRRAKTRALAEFMGHSTKDKILFNDNDEMRQMMENCKKKGKYVLNPIIDWLTEDVWEYLNGRNIKHCIIVQSAPVMGGEQVQAVLKYPGSKWRTAEWILKHFPEHHTYIEAFFGSGAVFFNKPASPIETINDLDLNVVNLFKIVREDPDELAKVIAATPFSRYEYDSTFEEQAPGNDLEKARRFLVQCWQGHGFRTNGHKVGWKNDVQGRERAYALSNWYRLPEWIMQATERLKQAQIENRPAIEVISRHKFKNVLIYADPPYVLGTRSGKQYKHEMTDQDHVLLLETLQQHPGPAIISGYRSDLYDSMLKDWYTESTGGYAEYYGGRQREEVIWMNFKPPVEQMSLIG